jgi:hypothetical protein
MRCSSYHSELASTGVALCKSFPKQSRRHVIHEKGAILELQTKAIIGGWSGNAVRKQATLPTLNYALLTLITGAHLAVPVSDSASLLYYVIKFCTCYI